MIIVKRQDETIREVGQVIDERVEVSRKMPRSTGLKAGYAMSTPTRTSELPVARTTKDRSVDRPVDRVAKSADVPVVRRIDHLILRVDDTRYEEFYSLLADTLRLPTPWPPTEHPTMRSGGIFAGNVDFEILYVPADHITDQAELYGLVFEAWAGNATGSGTGNMAENARALTQRGFAYLPSEYMKKETGKAPALLWTSYFLESFWQRNPWQRLIFGLKKLIPDAWWVRHSRDSSGNAKSVQWMFNQVFRQGIVFLVKYNSAWRDIDAERRISKAQLGMRAGGVLGLIRAREVAFGTTQLTESSARWRQLLRPAIEETGLCWQVGDGPALRVIAAERDALHHMVWEVASLVDAQAALDSLGLLGTVMPDQITLDPAKCFGLDIRLVEAPGAFTSER
jgi:hypothetical protein